MDKMKRLIECYVPIYACNMKCDYCYIKQNEGRHFEKKISPFQYKPDYIAKCLSSKRLGGTSLINLCAGGETLLSHEVVDLARYLLEEGHYVMIVNNGTITKHIKELCNLNPKLRARLWFRFSLHYLELLRLKKIDTFFDNVSYAKNSGCSIAVEMVASDAYIPYITTIKKICMQRIGSLPEISIARRESDFKTLTDLSQEDYQKIWGSFASKSFELKSNTVGIKRKEFCYAGDWTVTLDLKNGKMSKCYSECVQKIFDNPDEKIKFEAIGHHCPLPYCHNSHIWMTCGNIPELDFPTFAEIRDKKCKDGTYWLTKEMHDFIDCKLIDSNKSYSKIQKAKVEFKYYFNSICRKFILFLHRIKGQLL